jgi:hypothetical protein
VRLRKRLGSEDLANDVLHETYLRVDRMDVPPNLAQPNAYLYRMALNIAADRRQADARLLTGSEVEELLQSTDEAQDPSRVVGGQKEINPWSKPSTSCRRAAARSSSPPAWKKRRTWKSPALRHFHAHGREGNQGCPGLLRQAPGKKSDPAVRSRGGKTVLELSP